MYVPGPRNAPRAARGGGGAVECTGLETGRGREPRAWKVRFLRRSATQSRLKSDPTARSKMDPLAAMRCRRPRGPAGAAFICAHRGRCGMVVEMSLRQLKAVVVELAGDRAVLEFQDGSRREVTAAAQVQIPRSERPNTPSHGSGSALYGRTRRGSAAHSPRALTPSGAARSPTRARAGPPGERLDRYARARVYGRPDARPAPGSRRLDALCVGTVTMDRLGARAVRRMSET